MKNPSTLAHVIRSERKRLGFSQQELADPDFPALLENEHFFMRLAARCGISTAKTTLVVDTRGTQGLLVERFDRSGRGAVTEAHQEDACQFLDICPSEKYRISLSQIAEAFLNLTTAPKVEIAKLVRLYLYSYLTTNGGLHAKNISILEDPITNRWALFRLRSACNTPVRR